MRNHHALFAAIVLAVGGLAFVGCEKSDTGKTSSRSPANSRASENTPANTAREAEQAGHNIGASATTNASPDTLSTGGSDVTRTTNVQQNSTGVTGAGATATPGPTTRPSR